MSRIAIIGSGFGGLAEAIRLQARGFDVSVFEKREKVGGRAYQLRKNGYTFDMGPSLITAPPIIERVFAAAVYLIVPAYCVYSVIRRKMIVKVRVLHALVVAGNT